MSTATGPALSLLIDDPAPGARNMRRDLELLDGCARGVAARTLRLYGFAPPCLSLGRTQPLEDVDVDACRRDGVDVVRRPSGGRAVLHDQEVTYAVVCRADDPVFGGRVLDSCARIHAAVARGLALLGVVAVPRGVPRDLRADAREVAATADCFARPAAHELLDVQGRKLVGSAQARRGPALLQHGSVLLDAPRAAHYLRGMHDGATAAPATGGVRELLDRDVPWRELVDALSAGFSEAEAANVDNHRMMC